MTESRSKPEEWPGARVLRAKLRPETHLPVDVTGELDAWLGKLHADGLLVGRFVKHLVVSVDTRDGIPKGRRYSVRVVLWPAPPGRPPGGARELHPADELANSTRE
jgi:hypothetical protein